MGYIGYMGAKISSRLASILGYCIAGKGKIAETQRGKGATAGSQRF
jgi:hypothetical protein